MVKLISKNCVDFVKSFEGFYSNVYIDCVGVPTLGYGMTGNEIQGIKSVTENQASEMLENLLNNKYALPIKNDLDSKGITLTQNQFDSLVSMAYNIGTGGLLGSTLYKNVCAGVRDKATISSNFQAYSNGGGRRIEGLYRRRTAEAEMFFKNDNVLDEQVNKEDEEEMKYSIPDASNILPLFSGTSWIEMISENNRLILHKNEHDYISIIQHNDNTLDISVYGENQTSIDSKWVLPQSGLPFEFLQNRFIYHRNKQEYISLTQDRVAKLVYVDLYSSQGSKRITWKY